MTVRERLAKAGYYEWNSGAGMTAMRKEISGGKYVLATDCTGEMPSDGTKIFVLGLYGEDDDQMDVDLCATIAEVEGIAYDEERVAAS